MISKEDILNSYKQNGLDFVIEVNYDELGVSETYDIKLKDITYFILENELKDYYYFKNISKSTNLTPKGEAFLEILEDLKNYYRKLKIEKIRNNVGTRN